MTRNAAERQPNAIESHPVSPENERPAAERRRFEAALEDDEVYEALMSLHAETQPKRIVGAQVISEGQAQGEFSDGDPMIIARPVLIAA